MRGGQVLARRGAERKRCRCAPLPTALEACGGSAMEWTPVPAASGSGAFMHNGPADSRQAAPEASPGRGMSDAAAASDRASQPEARSRLSLSSVGNRAISAPFFRSARRSS